MPDYHRLGLAENQHQLAEEEHLPDTGDLVVETVQVEVVVSEEELGDVSVFVQLEHHLDAVVQDGQHQFGAIWNLVGCCLGIFLGLSIQIEFVKSKNLVQNP